MENKTKSKNFDAVKMMREIRDKISAETQGMNLIELKVYMEKKREDFKLKNLGK